MSHHIYRTDAIVLQSRERGEADRLLTLLTREFGVVHARAQSARLERSRLRYGLEPMTELSVSLIRGRTGWRVTGTRTIRQWYYHLSRECAARTSHVLALLERLLPEEGEGEVVYTHVEGLLESLLTSASKEVRQHEERCVLLILTELGYVPRPLAERYTQAHSSRAEVVRTINEALSASQL